MLPLARITFIVFDSGSGPVHVCAVKEEGEREELDHEKNIFGEVVRTGKPFTESQPQQNEDDNNSNGVAVIQTALHKTSEAVPAVALPAVSVVCPRKAASVFDFAEAFRLKDPLLCEAWAHVALDPLSEAAIKEVQDNRTDGAAALASLSVRRFTEAVQRWTTEGVRCFSCLEECVRALGHHFARARPSMAPIAVAVAGCASRVIQRLREESGCATTAKTATTLLLRETCDAVCREIATASETAGRLWLESVPTGATVVTLSWSGTVAKSLLGSGHSNDDGDEDEACAAKRRSLHVVVCESRTLGEGARFGEKLASSGVLGKVTVIPDCAALPFLETCVQSADSANDATVVVAVVVVVGADAVFGDASFNNKTGTRTLLLAARECGVRASVLCDTFKVSPEPRAPAAQLPVSEVDESPFFAPGTGVHSWSPLFEVTPLTTNPNVEFVTERGVATPADIARLSSLNRKACDALSSV